MRKFVIAATLVASTFAMSVGGAQAALTTPETDALASLTESLGSCSDTGTPSCEAIIDRQQAILNGAAVDAAFKKAFLKAALNTAAAAGGNPAAYKAAYAEVYLTPAGPDGCTFNGASPTSGCS